MSASSAGFMLAEGYVLLYGSGTTGLFHVVNKTHIALDEKVAGALENVLLSDTLDSESRALSNMRRDGILLDRPKKASHIDAILRSELERVDADLVREYRHVLSKRASKAYSNTLDAHAMRKIVQARMGQTPVLPETALRRALSVGDAQDVGKKKVACVGDDDLVCIALATLGHDVAVFDIDRALFQIIEHCNATMGLDIAVYNQDFRDPIPPAEVGTYDVFLTDPMANKACYELFLSRSLALLKPTGEGFVAVFAPASDVFRHVAQSMHLEVRHWHFDHNHYLLMDMAINRYMSDWVRVRSTPQTELRFKADAFCIPTGLYDEEFAGREAVLQLFIDGIETPYFANASFLHLILDELEAQKLFSTIDRNFCGGEHWSLLYCPIPRGHLVMYVDRNKRQLMLAMTPCEGHVIDEIHKTLRSGYKREEQETIMQRFGMVWDLRLR